MKVLLFLIILLAVLAKSFSHILGCPGGGLGRGGDDTNNCEFGWVMDSCLNKVCAKGPGEVCGGRHQRYGLCSQGLSCSNCDRCRGCSVYTFTCYDDNDCIW